MRTTVDQIADLVTPSAKGLVDAKLAAIQGDASALRAAQREVEKAFYAAGKLEGEMEGDVGDLVRALITNYRNSLRNNLLQARRLEIRRAP